MKLSNDPYERLSFLETMTKRYSLCSWLLLSLCALTALFPIFYLDTLPLLIVVLCAVSSVFCAAFSFVIIEKWWRRYELKRSRLENALCDLSRGYPYAQAILAIQMKEDTLWESR